MTNFPIGSIMASCFNNCSFETQFCLPSQILIPLKTKKLQGQRGKKWREATNGELFGGIQRWESGRLSHVSFNTPKGKSFQESEKKNERWAERQGWNHNYKEMHLQFWEGMLALWKHILSLPTLLMVIIPMAALLSFCCEVTNILTWKWIY